MINLGEYDSFDVISAILQMFATMYSKLIIKEKYQKDNILPKPIQ